MIIPYYADSVFGLSYIDKCIGAVVVLAINMSGAVTPTQSVRMVSAVTPRMDRSSLELART